MSTPQQDQAAFRAETNSRSMATILSELSTVLWVSMAGGGGLPTRETSQRSSNGSSNDDVDNVGAMERGGERSRAGTTKETMAKYGFHYSNEKRNGPLNVMHRFIKRCLEGNLREADSSAVWDHPLWSKLLTHATIDKSMAISEAEKKMVPLMSFFRDWENSFRRNLGLKAMSEASKPEDLLLCQLGRLIERNKMPSVKTLRSHRSSFQRLVDCISGTESGELCDGLLFALKCTVAQYVRRQDSNDANQVVSTVCAIIKGDIEELMRRCREFDPQTTEHKQMKEHGFILSQEGPKNALGAMHRFILHLFKSLGALPKLDRQYVNSLWANSVWSRLLRHANVTQAMGLSQIRDKFLASIMTVMKYVENSVRNQLGLKPLVLPAPQESFVVCHLARLSEICRSSKTSYLGFDAELTSLKRLIEAQVLSITETTPGSSHAKGVECRKKLLGLKVGISDLKVECENLVSSVLDDAFKFDVGEIASTSAVRYADSSKAKDEAKNTYDQYVESRMTEVGLERNHGLLCFGLIQFLFGIRIKRRNIGRKHERIQSLGKCSVWKSLLDRIKSIEGDAFSPEQLVEQLYETENRLRRHFGLQTIVKDPRNLRNEEGFVIVHLAKLCKMMEGERRTRSDQLKVWKKNFDQCFPTLPASHHLLQSTLSSIKGNCDGWNGAISQAINAVCQLIQSEDVEADVSPPTTPSLADMLIDWDEWNMMRNRTESTEVSEAPMVPSMETPTVPLLSIYGTDLTTMQSSDEELFHDCRELLADTERQDDCNDLESITPTIQLLGQDESDVTAATVGTVAQSLPAFASAFPMMAPFSSLTTNKLIDSCHFPLSPEIRKRAMEEMDAESHALTKKERKPSWSIDEKGELCQSL